MASKEVLCLCSIRRHNLEALENILNALEQFNEVDGYPMGCCLCFLDMWHSFRRDPQAAERFFPEELHVAHKNGIHTYDTEIMKQFEYSESSGYVEYIMDKLEEERSKKQLSLKFNPIVGAKICSKCEVRWGNRCSHPLEATKVGDPGYYTYLLNGELLIEKRTLESLITSIDTNLFLCEEGTWAIHLNNKDCTQEVIGFSPQLQKMIKNLRSTKKKKKK